MAMLSATAVFRDIAPGYPIRPPTEKELSMPVSKEIKATRDFEAGLLRSYQVRTLAAVCAFSESHKLWQPANMCLNQPCEGCPALTCLAESTVVLGSHRSHSDTEVVSISHISLVCAAALRECIHAWPHASCWALSTQAASLLHCCRCPLQRCEARHLADETSAAFARACMGKAGSASTASVCPYTLCA